MKNEAIAILFDQLEPYYWARLHSAARLFRVLAIETHENISGKRETHRAHSTG